MMRYNEDFLWAAAPVPALQRYASESAGRRPEWYVHADGQQRGIAVRDDPRTAAAPSATRAENITLDLSDMHGQPGMRHHSGHLKLTAI